MASTKPEFPIDWKLSLEKGTVVALYLPGDYTLDPELGIDVGYRLDYVERGGMLEDEVERHVKELVDSIMMPIVFNDPIAVAFLEREPEVPEPLTKPSSRRMKR